MTIKKRGEKSLTSAVRPSLHDFVEAAVFLQHTSRSTLSQTGLSYPHDVADKFFHTYSSRKGKHSLVPLVNGVLLFFKKAEEERFLL